MDEGGQGLTASSKICSLPGSLGGSATGCHPGICINTRASTDCGAVSCGGSATKEGLQLLKLAETPHLSWDVREPVPIQPPAISPARDGRSARALWKSCRGRPVSTLLKLETLMQLGTEGRQRLTAFVGRTCQPSPVGCSPTCWSTATCSEATAKIYPQRSGPKCLVPHITDHPLYGCDRSTPSRKSLCSACCPSPALRAWGVDGDGGSFQRLLHVVNCPSPTFPTQMAIPALTTLHMLWVERHSSQLLKRCHLSDLCGMRPRKSRSSFANSACAPRANNIAGETDGREAPWPDLGANR